MRVSKAGQQLYACPLLCRFNRKGQPSTRDDSALQQAEQSTWFPNVNEYVCGDHEIPEFRISGQEIMNLCNNQRIVAAERARRRQLGCLSA